MGSVKGHFIIYEELSFILSRCICLSSFSSQILFGLVKCMPGFFFGGNC